MILPTLDFLRLKLKIDGLCMHSPLKTILSTFNEGEVVNENKPNSSITFPVIIKKSEPEFNFALFCFELLDFFSECKLRNCSSEILFICYQSLSQSSKRRMAETVNLTYDLINLKHAYSLKYKFIDEIEHSSIIDELKKYKRYNYSINHFYNGVLINSLKKNTYVYLSKDLITTELIRHNLDFYFIRSSIKFNPTSIIAFLPSSAKKPPEGYCNLETLFRLLNQTQCSLECSKCKKQIEDNYPELWIKVNSLHEIIGFYHEKEKIRNPTINLHKSEHTLQNKDGVVILYGSPNIGLSNFSLISLCSSKKHNNKSLIVETVFPSIFYNDYNIENVKLLYRKLGSYFNFTEIIFTSDNIENFTNGLDEMLSLFTIKDFFNSLPFAKSNKLNTDISLNDIFHFSSMSFLLKKYCNSQFYIQARNSNLLSTIFRGAKNISYVACHDFDNYNMRFNHDDNFDEFVKSILEQKSHKPTSFQKQLEISNLIDGKISLLKPKTKTLKQVNIVTTHTISSNGGGVSLAIFNTLTEIQLRGLGVNLLYTTNYNKAESILDRIKLQDKDKFNFKNFRGVFLCYDFDGFNIPKSRKYLKVVFVRTDYYEWLKFEKCPTMINQLKHASEKLFENINNCDIIICNSDYTSHKIKCYLGKDNHTPIHTIYNGINTQFIKYLPKVYEVSDNQVVLAYGFFYERKRFDIFIEAANILNSNGFKCKYILIGDGPMREQIELLSKNNPDIIIKDYESDYEQLAYYLKSSSLVVHPSMQEDFGNPYIEAGAAFKPIIAPDNTITRELIKNGYNGLLYEANNSHMLASYIALVCGNKKLHKRLGQNGYNVSMKYTWENHVTQLLKIISEIL